MPKIVENKEWCRLMKNLRTLDNPKAKSLKKKMAFIQLAKLIDKIYGIK